MFTYVLGLISPEALTTDDKSSCCAFPVCTVATLLPLCRTVKPTMMASTTRTPAPIAIFFQGFMIFRHQPGYCIWTSKGPNCNRFQNICRHTFRLSTRVTDTHSEVRSCGQESSFWNG